MRLAAKVVLETPRTIRAGDPRQEKKKAVPRVKKKRKSKGLPAPVPIPESSPSDAEPSDADLKAIEKEEAPDLDVAV
jgi:hypothetical protein